MQCREIIYKNGRIFLKVYRVTVFQSEFGCIIQILNEKK